MAVEIEVADLSAVRDQGAVLDLTRAYARDPMGSGRDLDLRVQEELVAGLERHPTTLVFLAWEAATAVGIATCFLGFSTFAARPLVNLHDLFVRPEARRSGVGRRLLAALETRAIALGCCKLTLETQSSNRPAQALYTAFGFTGAHYEPDAGTTLFLQKRLDPR